MIYVKYGFVGLLRRSSQRGWVLHLPVQPRLLGPRKVKLMASNATPLRREGLVRVARKVIEGDREVFTEAGKRLAEIYSEKHLKQDGHDGKWDDKTSDELIFPRLDCARLGVINDDYPLGYTDMRFEELMPQAERKLAASMVVLALMLAIDPRANEYISKTMCPFAALPWAYGEDVPGILDREMICWIPSDHNSVDSPPGEVLDLLERATWSARTGDVMPVGMTIPTGDGRPCDETGTNPYDELSRAMLDVYRHLLVFKGNASEWAEITRHECREELEDKKNWLLEYNREWWASWEPALRRARDAIFLVNRAELLDRVQAAMDGLNTLASDIFPAPLMGRKGELPGDHLLRRGALRCDRKGQSAYPQEAIAEAYRPIGELIVGLVLYVDGTVNEKAELTDRLVPEAQNISIATDPHSNLDADEDKIEPPVQLEYKQVALLQWLGSSNHRHRVFKRTEIIIDDPGVPTDTKNMRMSINMLHDLGLVDSPPKRNVKITKAGLAWLETQQSTHEQ